MVNRNIVQALIDRVLSETVTTQANSVKSNLLGAVVQLEVGYGEIAVRVSSTMPDRTFALAGADPDERIPKDVVAAVQKDVLHIAGTHLSALERNLIEVLTSRHNFKMIPYK